MCGITGVAGNNTKIYDEALNNMLASLSKRGPDDRGTLSFPHCTLGQTRLSVIDLSSGHQPMRDNKRDMAITFNGEIYNYRELKQDLEKKGYSFSTNSDTEVILKAYQEYGKECTKHLDGMFAFAIWDNENDQLFMARDRFGKKPFYYAFDDQNNLIFASEAKAIFASGKIKGVLSKGALDNYLELMYVPPWKSIYENIFVLPPAHSAIHKDNSITIERYWKLTYTPSSLSYEEAKKETRRLLDEAVKKRVIASDVEVGSLLSGGVDSTFVSLLAQKYLKHPLKTFALGYGDYINELPYAEEASRTIGSEHHTLQASGGLIEELEAVNTYFDEPHADSSDFPQHMISRLAASKVKVALSGDGGDEIFMGYGWHARHMNLSYRKNPFEKLFMSPLRGRVYMTRVFSPLQRLMLWGSPFRLHKDIFAKGAYQRGIDAIREIITFDLTTYLPGQLLTKVDRTSMMHGLEVRSPFLDTALVEFVYNLPIEYKMDQKGYKIILKDLLSEYMPHKFVYRRKQGFGAPIGKWLREPRMKSYVQDKLGSDAFIRTIFVSKTIDFLLKDFYNRNNDRRQLKIWTLLCLELWVQSHKQYFA